MATDVTYHDDQTLMKARLAIATAIGEAPESHTVTDVIGYMQNRGLLIRERTDEARNETYVWEPSDTPRQMVFKDDAPEDTSDGFHTFAELYDHRRALTAVLAANAAQMGAAWRSKQHHPDDDPMFEGGYFIVGIVLDVGTISYHYKLKYWDNFATVPELPHAPKWDGHTPADVVARLDEQTEGFRAHASENAEQMRVNAQIYGWEK